MESLHSELLITIGYPTSEIDRTRISTVSSLEIGIPIWLTVSCSGSDNAVDNVFHSYDALIFLPLLSTYDVTSVLASVVFLRKYRYSQSNLMISCDFPLLTTASGISKNPRTWYLGENSLVSLIIVATSLTIEANAVILFLRTLYWSSILFCNLVRSVSSVDWDNFFLRIAISLSIVAISLLINSFSAYFCFVTVSMSLILWPLMSLTEKLEGINVGLLGLMASDNGIWSISWTYFIPLL